MVLSIIQMVCLVVGLCLAFPVLSAQLRSIIHDRSYIASYIDVLLAIALAVLLVYGLPVAL